jgi:hypothetical protein
MLSTLNTLDEEVLCMKADLLEDLKGGEDYSVIRIEEAMFHWLPN